ncbi:hypothetical protein Rsph17029_0609 [Rhodobacter sphaeroides ATCC 17029]|nr:hypothetical protein Rsph17029_0609 [Cereibacter sphaeroides ATCC 17029]
MFCWGSACGQVNSTHAAGARSRPSGPASAALRAALEAQVQALAVENAELRTRNARLEHLVRELQRARFGPRSEKLHPDQMELAFEDIELALAAATEEHDAAVETRTRSRASRSTSAIWRGTSSATSRPCAGRRRASAASRSGARTPVSSAFRGHPQRLRQGSRCADRFNLLPRNRQRFIPSFRVLQLRTRPARISGWYDVEDVPPAARGTRASPAPSATSELRATEARGAPAGC